MNFKNLIILSLLALPLTLVGCGTNNNKTATNRGTTEMTTIPRDINNNNNVTPNTNNGTNGDGVINDTKELGKDVVDDTANVGKDIVNDIEYGVGNNGIRTDRDLNRANDSLTNNLNNLFNGNRTDGTITNGNINGVNGGVAGSGVR